MHILLLDQSCVPWSPALDELLTDVAGELVHRGHQVHVMGCRTTEPSMESAKSHQIDWIDGCGCGTRKAGTGSLGYIAAQIRMAIKALRLPKVDVCVVLATPDRMGSAGGLLQMIRGTRLVLWMMDSQKEPTRADGTAKSGLIHRTLARMDRSLCRKVEGMICLDEASISRLMDANAEAERVAVIDNWRPENEYPTNAMGMYVIRKHRDRRGMVRLVYSGCVNVLEELESLLWSLQRWESDVSLRAMFLEHGRIERLIDQPSAHLGVNQIILDPPMAMDRFVMDMNGGSINIVIQRPEVEGDHVPGKVYSAFAAERCVLFLGSEDSEGARIVRKSRGGIVADPDDIVAVADALVTLGTDAELRQAMALRGRAHYEEHFGREPTRRRILEVIEAAFRT